MKKFLKFFGITVLTIAAIIYLGFLFVIPNILDAKAFKPQILKLVSDNSPVNIDYKSAKIFTTPALSAGLKVSELKVSEKDGNELASINYAKISVKLLPIIFKKIEGESIDISGVNISLDMYKDGHFKIQDTLFTQNKETAAEQQTPEEEQEKPIEQQTQNTSAFIFSDEMPVVTINDLNLTVKNIDTNTSLTLKNEKLKLDKTVLNKHARLFLQGKLLSNNSVENIKYNIKLDSFLPKMEETAQTEQKPEQEAVFYDFVNEFIKYNPTADINADLKIRNKKENIELDGIANIDKIGFKLNSNQLKDGFIHTNFDSKKMEFTSDIPISLTEKFNLSGMLKKHNIELAVKTQKASFKSLQELAVFILDMMNIKNDFASLKTEGYITSDFTLKMSENKMNSNGEFNIINGGISSSEMGLYIKDIQSKLNFAGNKLLIENTKALVNDAQFNISGNIDTNTNTDILIKSDALPVGKLINTFMTGDLKNTYDIKQGTLDISATLKGKFEAIKPQVNAKLKGLNIKDKINDIDIVNELLNIDITSDGKTFSGKIKNNNLNANINALQLKANVPSLELSLNPEDISLAQTTAKINNSSINIQGEILDYMKTMQMKFLADGKINTQDIKNFLPKEYKSMVQAKGELPVVAEITGTPETINFKSQILSNAMNNFTVFSITKLLDKPSILNIDLAMNGNTVDIKNAGLYTAKTNGLSKTLSENISFDTQSAWIKATGGYINSKNPTLKNFNLIINDNCEFKSPAMPNTYLTLKGSINADGYLENPALRGNLIISSLSLPDYLIKLQAGNIVFNTDNINATLMGLDLNGSNMDVKAVVSNKLTMPYIVQTVNADVGNLDLDKVLKVADKFAAPAPSTSSTSQSASTNNQEQNTASAALIPVTIQKGSANIAKFTMGTLELSNIKSNFTLHNDLLNMTDMSATAYKGNVTGNIGYNLNTLAMNAKLKGEGIDANPAITAFLGIKDQVMGTLKFDADVTLKGAELEEQLGSLNGTTTFEVTDGQLGSLGRLETYLGATNIMVSSIVKNQVSSVISTLLPYNSGKISYLKGNLKFTNGTVHFNPITSSGKEMALNVTGKLNLLNNTGDITILGKLSESVASSLGAINNVSLDKLLNQLGTFGAVAKTLLGTFNTAISDNDIKSIPDLTPTSSFRTFKVLISGNIYSASAVKSFQWAASQSAINNAENSIIQSSSATNAAPIPATKEELIKTTQTLIEDKLKEQSEKYKDTNTGKAIQTIQTFGKAFLEEQAKQAQQAGQTKQGGQ